MTADRKPAYETCCVHCAAVKKQLDPHYCWTTYAKQPLQTLNKNFMANAVEWTTQIKKTEQCDM